MYGVQTAAQDQQGKLNTLVNNTMLNLSLKAAYNLSQKYAVGMVNFTSSVPLYELVQCTRNLSNDECYQCLSDLVGLLMLANCSSGKLGGRVLRQSCYVRFETVEFFNPSLLSSSDAVPGSSPGTPEVSILTSPVPASKGHLFSKQILNMNSVYLCS
jgi:Salt stress response/antifungal